jgi:predicted metal-dependent phosphoesterase TrpH
MRRILVDLHAHSTASDGALAPPALAELLSSKGIALAALTDHNTSGGLEAFRERAKDLGMMTLSGMEIDLPYPHPLLPYRGFDIHVLCYGFDPRSPAFSGLKNLAREENGAPAGKRSLKRLLDAAHEAGALAFLAHPLSYPGNREDHERLVYAMKEEGLDGIEAYYSPYDRDEREALIGWARACDFLVSGGSDFHRSEEKRRIIEFPGALTVRRVTEPGIEIPVSALRRFLDRLGIDGSLGGLA